MPTKDPKLLVKCRCTSKNVYLFKPKPDDDFHIRFTPPRQVRLKLGIRERVLRSTGHKQVAPARERAAAIVESFWKDDGAADAVSRMRSDWAPLEKILDAYDPLPDDVAPAVAVKNRQALRLLVREGAKLAPDRATSAVFADDGVIRRFQKSRMEAVRDEDIQARESAAVTVNSTVRQARSVFAKRHLFFYEGLKLPDLTAFLKAPALKVDKDMSFVPFATGMIERIEKELPAQSRNVRLAVLLMLYLGLRNKEVQFAKWEWFRWFGDGTAELSIERRPYFKVKNRSVRTIQLDPELAGKLAGFRGAPDAWVIDAPTETGRFDVTHDEINEWLRTIIVDRTKCAYELRKHAGSVVLTRPESEGGGLAAAARFLGDTIVTTEKHYARLLRPVHAVRSGEVSTARFEIVRTVAA